MVNRTAYIPLWTFYHNLALTGLTGTARWLPGTFSVEAHLIWQQRVEA
ncbi:MAG: hypothetical protein WA624_14060 [Methylocella sp.]